MAWRGREEALELHTPQEFADYLRGLNFANWRPSGMVLHNTASPTLDQWWNGGTPPEQRMENLQNYYENEMGWSAGPHAFVDGVSIWVMTDFNVQGVHSPSYNGTRLGIEMVGDYDSESDETGMGAKVMQLTVALFGECHKFFGWEPNNEKIKLHMEDPATDHDCPGDNIVKPEFLDDVTAYMGEGGDDQDQPWRKPLSGTVANLAPGDTLNIRAAASSSAQVIGQADNGDKVDVVGESWNGSTHWLRLRFGRALSSGVSVSGWASADYIAIEGELPEAQIWRFDIEATEFGGSDETQESAYGGWVDGDALGVALPYKWKATPRPEVLIRGPHGEIRAPIVDLGPWNIHDPWYVLHGRRPLVEKQYEHELEAQNGLVPTNKAAIDLTPPTADAIGVSGKGVVSWRFV